MSSLEVVIATLDKIIASHKESINKGDTVDQMEKAAGEIFSALGEGVFLEKVEQCGGYMMETLSLSVDENIEFYKKLDKDIKDIYIRMFEAKLLEAQGKCDFRPDDHADTVKLITEKFEKLSKV